MKNLFSLLTAFLIVPMLICASPNADLSEIAEPPADAPIGQVQDGVQIGLWTEKAVYKGNEIRNVWMLVRNDRSSSITIGVGGSLYAGSYLFVTTNSEEVAKFPIGGGIDGIVNPTRISGGLSEQLSTLPAGIYQLVWKTETHESNKITIEIKTGEQLHSPFNLIENAPEPQMTPIGTVKALYGDKIFFGLRNSFPTPVIQHLSACFTPELTKHFHSCREKIDKWLAENRDENLKLNIGEGPIFISNYEGANDFDVGESRIEGDRAEVSIAFTYSEGGKTFRWVNVAILRSIGGYWLLDDIHFRPETGGGGTLKKSIDIDTP